MDESPPLPELETFEALHTHAGFVKRLARGLLRDEAEVEDAVQETWLAALRRGPRSLGHEREARGWLTRVVRNGARLRGREERHRASREESAARPEAVAGGARAVEELEIHRHLVEAVLALREPYRTTIVLRFFEERSLSEVARLAQVPVETVRTRTRRGLNELRAALDRRHDGDRTAWMGALAPLVGARELAVGGAALGGLAVTMTTAKWAAGVSAILIGALLWRGAVGGAGDVDSRAEGAGPVLELPRVGAGDARAGSESGALVSERAEPARSRIGAANEAGAANAIEGTIEVVDEDGRVHAKEDGEVVLALPGSSFRGRFTVVPVQGGRWRMVDPPPHPLALLSAELGGRPAWVEPAAARLSGDPPYSLRVTWIPRSWLRVVGGMSGIELSDVTVLTLDVWEAGVFHPSIAQGEERVASGDPSPIELPYSLDVRNYWVRATGYAWKRVKVDHRQGGERVVELDPGATLEVTTSGGEGAPWGLRLYPAGYDERDPVYAELDRVPGMPIVIHGLPAGPLQVRAEIGEWFDPPVELAREEVELVAGETERLHLELDRESLGVEAGPVTGTLVLPPGVHPNGIRLSLGPARGPDLRPGDGRSISAGRMRPTVVAGEYAWEATELTPGRVKLVVGPLQLTQMIDVPPGGLQGVRVVVPELCEIVARAVDARTGEVLPVEQIAWGRFEPGLATFGERTPGSEAERALKMTYLHPRDELGTIRFRAPIGRILLGSGLDGYDEDGAWFELESGTNELELPLEPRCTLVIGFTVDGRDVGGVRGFQVVPVGHEGEWHQWSREGHRYLGTADEPGLYRVEGELEGYLPFDPREVRLARGERAEVEIALVPLR